MSFFIIQQNVQQIIQNQKRTRVMVAVDCYFQPKPNAHLLSTNLYHQQYSIVIQTKYVQNIQILFQTQIRNKYIKLKFKPIRILAKSQRSIIQLSNKLQFYNKQNKNHFYKWYLNKNGHLNVQIMYLLQQFLNHLHAQFILDKTIREITDAFQNILVDMLGYLNLENLIESFQEENTQCDTEQQEVKVAEKIKYLMLLNEVYKKHRRSQFLFYQLQKDKTKQNQLISKIQAYEKSNILVQDDISFVQLIQKQKKQYQQRLKSVMKLITPKLNDKVDHLNMYKMYLTQKQFQKYVKSFKKEHLQIYQITNMHFRIVRGIQNQVLISKQKIISSNGSHSDIYLGTYCLQLSQTLFTYQHQGNQEEAQKKVVVKPLICKRIKSHEQSASVNSFRNQVMFLHFAKDKRSKFISTYFIPFNKAKDQVSQIYAQFYESNLKEHLEKCKKKSENEVSLFKILDLAQHIILALIFLVQSGILHRDLKPFNIMIDKNQKARLIDFGSCCPIFNRNEFEAAQKRILTTPAYQIKYRQCPEHVKQKYSKSEYEQHILFDVYSFGVTLKQMIQYVKDLEQVGKKENVNVAQIIDLIVARCKQPDPIERVTFDELLYFIKVLKEIQKNN